jgi:hypothetical protein
VHHACDALCQPAHTVLQYLLQHLRAIAHDMGWAHVSESWVFDLACCALHGMLSHPCISTSIQGCRTYMSVPTLLLLPVTLRCFAFRLSAGGLLLVCGPAVFALCRCIAWYA